MVTIRAATAADRAVLTDFGRRTFYETFAADNTPDDMAAYLAGAFSEAKQSAELADPHRVTLFAERLGRVLGYAQLHFGSVPDCVDLPGAAELVRLYVDSDVKGQGVARQLMEAVERAAAERSQAIWLGVWERNPRAIAFYKKCGLVAVGTHAFTLGRDAQLDHIMVKTIGVTTAG